jgi:uncharacterized protein (DUF3084 family)
MPSARVPHLSFTRARWPGYATGPRSAAACFIVTAAASGVRRASSLAWRRAPGTGWPAEPLYREKPARRNVAARRP